MHSDRRIAVVAGVLFIIATVADLISRVAFEQPILSAQIPPPTRSTGGCPGR